MYVCMYVCHGHGYASQPAIDVLTSYFAQVYALTQRVAKGPSILSTDFC